MTDKPQMPWRSRRSDFPWLVEREVLLKRQQERIERGEYELNQHGFRNVSHRAPVEDVLKLARVARDQPEIWSAVQSIVERSRRNPDTDLTEDENFFFADFREWYRLKHDLPYSSLPFMVVDRLLLRIANGFLPDDLDDPRVREFLLEDPSVVEA